MKRVILVVVVVVLATLGLAAYPQEKLPHRSLRSEGNLATDGVSVFYDYGHVYFGKLVCQETFTEPTVIFYSPGEIDRAIDRPRDFSMNVEFLREIVQIADAEYAKSKCKGGKP